jgi:4-aminobutyrate aminotransferase-like enzyme
MTHELLQRRERLMGPKVPTFYDEPVHLVRGEGVWLWDATGRRYLDCYNNVPHVGHCHPRVVEAIAKQAGLLNTHTRYLHGAVLDYIEKLTATFPPELATAVLACTGSEANDLALRMAEAITGKRGVIATDHSYHGNTTAVTQVSSKYRGASGAWPNIRLVPAPDSYRPQGGEAGRTHSLAFAASVEAAIASLEEAGHGVSALMICPFFANEGFPDLPQGWLDPAVAAVRKAGGVIISDEVQPGFGRLGSHMWGSARIGLVPDIVTLGKPMGNGYPVSGVVTTQDHIKTFRNAIRYFNTYGGNPVAAAAALATLQVIEDEGLMQNAQSVGAYIRHKLEQLATRHAVIGDVRGAGFFLGAELVTDRVAKTPATVYTARFVNAMCQRGILLNSIGIHGNVLKIRPPMPFSRENADLLIDTLDEALNSLPVVA